MQEPTPKQYRGDITRIEWSPQCCDRWVVRPAQVEIPSLLLNSPGQNWDNASGMICVGQARDALPDCNVAPLSSRWALVIAHIKGNTEIGEPEGLIPGPVHIEMRAGDEGVMTRFARVVWLPNDWRDSGWIVQVEGPLVTQVQVWAWAELVNGVSLPLLCKFHLLLDRIGAASLPPNGTRNQLITTGANVFLDVS